MEHAKSCLYQSTEQRGEALEQIQEWKPSAGLHEMESATFTFREKRRMDRKKGKLVGGT
ncbi:MAG: hypothetical protein HXS51_14105 [Theionarchaea archaeon]|nr:hypothetical protein [Theionarchaea archaeon]MBU7001894.1 hypothetical protein [Theionarchaea archaeon]MBU7040839.1 hypothetical protein [Theionarchaea archaeon]